MSIFLIIVVIVLLSLAGLAFYSINARRPKFFKGSLKPLEKSLFERLKDELGEPAGTLVAKQLAFLKRGVRLYFPKSYSVELFGEDQNPMQEDILFVRRDEFKLATLSFTVGTTKYKTEFTTYSGRIWGLTVRPSPKGILGMSIAKIDMFSLNNDPMEKLDLQITVEYHPAEHSFGGSLGELANQYDLREIRKALPGKQKELYIKLSETQFPKDLLELYDQTNGFIIDGIRVAGLGSLQEVALEDDNYLMIAEKEGGCLSIKKTLKNVELKYHSYEDQTDIRDLGTEFLTALDKFIKIE